MKSIFALLFVICCFVATLHGKHTLKVDNVYPNFGDTVLISGPLTTDRLGSDTLNVGELNILSTDGINITTRGDFTLSGAGIDAKNSQNLTIAATGANATFSVVAATTISFNGENAAIGSNGVVTLAALGDFGFTGGDFLVFANQGLLQGDYLNIVSEEGHVIARSFGAINTSSAGFSAKAIDFLELSAANTFTLDALQSISLESSYTSLVSDSLVIRADRNNALLSGYAGTTLIANSFQARVKGDATITAANGVINYSELQNLRMIANDDFEIFAHDAATFTANGDARINAANNLYMLSDNESHFQFGSGSISADNNLDMFSGARLLMKSGNDQSLRVVNGPFIATAADYAMFNADQALAFTARQDINLLGEQGIDIRAERSTVFLGRGKNSLSNNKPITYASLSNIETRASDLRLDVATLSINAAVNIAFTTEQSIRDSRVQFDSATNTTVTANNAFGWTGNTVNVQASRDLKLTASGAITLGIVNTGDFTDNELSITNGASFTQTTSGQVTDVFEQQIFNAADEIRVQAAQISNFIASDLNVRFGGDFVVLAPEMRLAAEKSAVFETGAYSIVGSSSVQYNTGAFNLDVTGTVSYSLTDDFTVNARNGNIQHDADLFTANVEDTSSYNAARNVIINGAQSYQYESAVFNGNFLLASPPGGDIVVGGDNVTIAGPASLVASFVNINVENDLTFEPFTFTVTSFVEQPITINVGDDLNVYGYEVFFRADPLDYDHEFFFDIDDSFTVTVGDQIDLDFRFLTEFRVANDASITQESLSDLPDFLHFIGHDMSLTANSVSFTSEIGNVHMIANGGVTRLHALENINVDTTHAHLRGAESYLRSLGEITQTAASYTMLVRDTFQLYGGDATITADVLFLEANSDINIYTSGDFTVSSVNGADLAASELFDIHSKLITFEAPLGTNFVNAADGVAISSAENRTLSIQQFNAAGANTIESTGDSISFLANDELRFMIDGDVTATAAQNVLFQTSAQSADQYFGSGSTVITADELVAFNAFDVAFREGNVVVDATTAQFIASEDVNFAADGTEYDPLTGDEYAFLARAKRTVGLTTAGDISTNDARSLSFYSATSSYSHTSVTDITLQSLQDGLIIRSADDITLLSAAAGNFQIGNYSTWQSTRDLTWTVGTDFSWASSGDFDVHADRGEIFFQNSAVFDDTIPSQSTVFTANSIIGEGGDSFDWTTGDTVIDSGAVELYGDSAFAFTSTGTVSWTASRDGLVSSSTNNDILYEATGTWTGTADFISLEARRDAIWRAGGLTFTASDNQKLTSKGSLDVESDAATSVTATTGDVTFQQRNSASFEALGDILVGSVTPGIVTINTGGSAQAYGQSWTAKDTLTVTSNNGVRLESSVYRVRSDTEINVKAAAGLTIESQGVETIGQDIYFEASGDQTFTALNSIALVGGSARYEYDNSLEFSAGTNLLLQSSTFIRADVEQDLQQNAPLLTVNAASYSYQSKGDSEYLSSIGSGVTQFTATKTTTTLQSQDNMNFVGTNTLNIFTAASNAPIIIESQGVDSNIYSTTDASTSTSNGATSILAKNGVLITDFASATISAADTYRSVSSGDYEYSAVVITKTSQGEISYDSRANLFGNIAGAVTLSATRDLIFDADKDIAFNVSPGIDDNPVLLTVNVDGLTDLGFGGDWQFRSDFSTQILAGTADWRAAGEDGVLISSQGAVLINQVGAGQTFVTANNLRAESLKAATFTSTADSLYQTNNGAQFSALEQPTDLLFTGNAFTVNAAGNIELEAFGFLPSSGNVVISATGTVTDPALAYFLNGQAPLTQQKVTPGVYSNLFLASNNDVEINAQQARFSVETSRGIYVYQPEQAGSSLLFAADGADENNRGIEIQGNGVLLQSLRNVIHRSNNMYFHELASDQTIGALNTAVGRPTMFSFRDQVYDAAGGNVNGNGIQIQSDAPSHSISFDVDNVVFDSGNGVLVDAELGAVFTLSNDASFYSHSSVYIAGQGNNVEDSSVYFSTGKIDTTNGGIAGYGSDMRFFADDDLLVRSVDHILADIENRLFLESGNIAEVYGAQGVNVYTTHPNDWSSVGSTINIEAQNDVHVTSSNVIEFSAPTVVLAAIPQEGPNRGNIFIGTPNVAEASGITIGGANSVVTFNSRNVEIGSDAALVFPVLGINQPIPACATFPGSLTFNIEGTTADPVPFINFCDHTNILRRVRLIADNLV